MDFFCLTCGHINENSEVDACENCTSPLNEELYNRLTRYASTAVHYGYDYRLRYEKQVKENGIINIKYSLQSPTNYYEWLAVAALSGMLGNLAYDIVKKVAWQILNKLTEKNDKDTTTNKDKEILILVSNEVSLNQFTNYIQAYYKDLPNIDSQVKKVIIEEELVHSITDDMDAKKVLNEATKNEEDVKEYFGDLFLKAAKKIEDDKREKPNYKEFNDVLNLLKKEIKLEKKKAKRKK